ncbi:MAG: rhodanese-like domain-containing protein [Bdellovibrionales bacterium]|nr:rhodanese-like domain-containing protein [Bdellovibrionales bacterium]
MNEVILDVRERDEYEAEHVEHSINVPLSHFATIAPGVLNQLGQANVVILCRSGNRAKLAFEQVKQLGYADKIAVRVYEGGIMEWKRAGNPTLLKHRSGLPIMRQVQLAAGLMILASTILGAFVNPAFLGVTAFVGAGLTVAGSTGFCGMAILLSKMPWNKLTANRCEK